MWIYGLKMREKKVKNNNENLTMKKKLLKILMCSSLVNVDGEELRWKIEF
jgi:hypothetical protein